MSTTTTQTNRGMFLYATPIGTFGTYEEASDRLEACDIDPCEPGMIEAKPVQYTDVYWIDGHKLSNPVRVF